MFKIKEAKFVTSAGYGSPLLETNAPQIAMVGKSNVGKSSLINALCNQRKLAKTSQQPGKTRLINYFSINSDAFFLVDLPGYGFAKAPKSEKKKWGELIEAYLQSGQVNHIFLLLDSRHAPTADDRQMHLWIEYYSIPYTILATKLDKFAKSKRPMAIQALEKELKTTAPIIGCSSEEKIGLQAIDERMGQIINDTALLPHEEE